MWGEMKLPLRWISVHSSILLKYIKELQKSWTQLLDSSRCIRFCSDRYKVSVINQKSFGEALVMSAQEEDSLQESGFNQRTNNVQWKNVNLDGLQWKYYSHTNFRLVTWMSHIAFTHLRHSVSSSPLLFSLLVTGTICLWLFKPSYHFEFLNKTRTPLSFSP